MGRARKQIPKLPFPSSSLKTEREKYKGGHSQYKATRDTHYRTAESGGGSAWETLVMTDAELEKSAWKRDVLVNLEMRASFRQR